MKHKRTGKKRVPLNYQIALCIMLFILCELAVVAINNTGYIIGNYAMQKKSAITYTGRCVSYEREDNPPTRYSTDKTYFILHMDNGMSVGVYRAVFDIDALAEKEKKELLSQELELNYIPVHPFPFDDQTEMLLTIKSRQQVFIVEGQVQAAYHKKLSNFSPVFIVFSLVAVLIAIIPSIIKYISQYKKRKRKMRKKEKKKNCITNDQNQQKK